MTDEIPASAHAIPHFTIEASQPGAAKALRVMAAAIRVTNPPRAAEIDKIAAEFEAYASRRRDGAGFIASR